MKRTLLVALGVLAVTCAPYGLAILAGPELMMSKLESANMGYLKKAIETRT